MRPWARRWITRRWPLFVVSISAAAAACSVHSGVAGGDLAGLVAALERSTGGDNVDAADVRWEPSGGLFEDLIVGRNVLFLARRASDESRDVWRARVRVAPDGRMLAVAAAHDITNTPLGDEHALVVSGTHAAFATRAYGQEQSATLLDLSGEGLQNRAARLSDRTMAAITNLQRTGSIAGIGRVDVTFDSPGRAVGLQIDETSLEISLFGGDPRRPPTVTVARFDLARRELSPSQGMHADAAMHLPKRFSHWTVDTLRAVSWIGPAPVAFLEDQALAVRDTFRRMTFSRRGSQTDVVAATDPPPPLLDTSQASVDEAHWPPPPIATIWKSAEAGEGQWVVPPVEWLRSAKTEAHAPSAFYETFVRPDEERPYVHVFLVAMDMRQLDLDMEGGVEDPEPTVGPPGGGRIPRDPAIYKRVAAAFNGAFKTEHGHYGMMVHKRVLLPPVPGAATVVVLDDKRAGFGTWGADKRVGGIVGVTDDGIASFRQNLDPLIDHGQINPTGRNMWGFTLPGKGAQTERSGLCVTAAGHLVYAWGDDLSGTTLARAMQMAGCDFGMHLDMNPYHTGFVFTSVDDPAAKKYKTQILNPGMSIPSDRYVQYSPKDFFYVLAHDPRPPRAGDASVWEADGGTQPPPGWLPGVFGAIAGGAGAGRIELIDVEPGRATWRLRAGAKDAVAATPAREMSGEEAKHVLFAVGMGVAPGKRSLGLATDGRLAVAARGGADLGALIVDDDGKLVIEQADVAPVLGARGDLAELPIVLWDGQSRPWPAGVAAPRGAIGITPTDRVILARGNVSGDALAQALARAGCTRGLLLDRGAGATGLFERAGTETPPRARYDETVLYAVALALRPRGFHFEPSTLVASQASRSK